MANLFFGHYLVGTVKQATCVELFANKLIFTYLL